MWGLELLGRMRAICEGLSAAVAAREHAASPAAEKAPENREGLSTLNPEP